MDADCGFANGSATINTAGNLDLYNFTWSPNIGANTSQFGNIRTSLPSGIYNVVITSKSDASCFTSVDAVVGNNGGPQVLAPVVTDATCGNTNGSIQFTITGNESIRYSDGSTDNPRTGLAAGTYSVEIIDNNNPDCPAFVAVTVGENSGLMVTSNITQQPGCDTNDGAATINVGGGSGDYSYSWGTGPTRTDLAAGTQVVTVTDNQTGCSEVTSFTLVANDVEPVTINIVPATVQLPCAGTASGFVNADLILGPNFFGQARVEITDLLGNVVPNGSLSAGEYFLLVFDGNNCVAGQTGFSVVEPSAVEVDIQVANEDCDNRGSINLEIRGGTAPYTVDWADIAGTNDVEDRTDVTSLSLIHI